MAIADDFAVSAAKAITYTGAAHAATGAGYYTVIEFHRWLSDIADDEVPATANDLVDITSLTPSERSTDNIIKLINGYNIDDAVSEHLFDGSIIQGDNGVDEEIWDGLVVIANPDMDLQILQSGAQEANDFWNTVMFNDAGQNPSGFKGLNRDEANGISHRFMLKVRDSDADLDGRRIIGMTRVDFTTDTVNGKTFSEFKVNGTARGNNVLALTFANDLNDTTDASGRAGIVNIKEGFSQIDVDANGSTEDYYSEWNRDAFTINQFYERMKYLSRGEAANAGTLYGLDAKIFRGITHELDITDLASGNWAEPEALSWTGGTGQLLAVDNITSGSATKIWMQILTGVAPTSGTITGATNSATGTVTAATERVVSTPFVGVSTGAALIGAYGLGLEALDLGPNDLVFDLTNTSVQAPTNVTFTIGGVVNGEDRILVGPSTGATALDTGQFQVSTTVSSGGGTLIVKLGTETPGTGTKSEKDTPNTSVGGPSALRVQEDTTGIYKRVTYTAYTVGSGIMTFTGLTGLPDAVANNNVFIGYIDALYDGTTTTDRYTATFGGTNRSLFIRIRDGGTAGDAEGIKTYEAQASLGSSDQTANAIRTSDA